MQPKYFRFSEKCKREQNEDSFIVFSLNPDNHCFIVCDGVGGQEYGELASQTITQSIHQFYQTHPFSAFNTDNIQQAIHYAHQQLQIIAQQHHYPQMASTIALLALSKTQYIKCWAGDSRIFHWNEKNILSETVPHSLVHLLIQSGEITPEEAAHHPKKNIITRAITTHTLPQPDFETGSFQATHKFLLCSDGLLEAVSNETLINLWNNYPRLNQAGQFLKEQALAHSADNTTAILIEFSKPPSNLFHYISQKISQWKK